MLVSKNKPRELDERPIESIERLNRLIALNLDARVYADVVTISIREMPNSYLEMTVDLDQNVGKITVKALNETFGMDVPLNLAGPFNQKEMASDCLSGALYNLIRMTMPNVDDAGIVPENRRDLTTCWKDYDPLDDERAEILAEEGDDAPEWVRTPRNKNYLEYDGECGWYDYFFAATGDICFNCSYNVTRETRPDLFINGYYLPEHIGNVARQIIEEMAIAFYNNIFMV